MGGESYETSTSEAQDKQINQFGDSEISQESKIEQVKKEEEDPQQVKYDIKTINCFGAKIDLPLVSLMLMNFFLNAACSVITPFFPPLAQGTYKTAPDLELSSFQVGLVIGMHPAAGFIFGMVMSKYLMNFGRKKVMVASLLVTILTCIGMGASYYLKESNSGFFAVNLICRAFMGMARSGYGSATFAYAPMLWPHKVPRMIAMMESATGMGLMMGPIIGAGIAAMFGDNEELKYQMVFYILSFIFLIFVYPSYIMLPQDQKIPPKQKTLSLFKVLGRRQIWTLFFLLTLVSTSITFTYELWTNHLATYGVSENMSAIWLTSASMTYIVALQTIPIFLKKYVIDRGLLSFRKVLESIGIFLSAFLLLFMAPETAIGIPQDAWPLIFGMFIAGYAQGLAILPYIPEQNMLVVQYYPKREKEILNQKLTEQVTSQFEEERMKTGKEFTEKEVTANVNEIIRKLYSDMAAGMFMSGYSLGTFAGPTIGGFIFDIIENTEAAVNSECYWGRALNIHQPNPINPCANQFAFEILGNIIMFTCILFGIFYMTLGDGYQGWKDLCASKAKKANIDDMSQPLNTDQGGLSDVMQTDNEIGFTEDENRDEDEEVEERLKMLKKKSQNEIDARNSNARSSTKM